MKKFLALAALVLGLASCQTEPEGLDVNVGGAVDTEITVSLPDMTTRAGGSNSATSDINAILATDDYTMRYMLQVFYGDKPSELYVRYSDSQMVSFPVRLVPGQDRDYNFVVWADIVKQVADLEDDVKCADLHYAIGEDLRDISVIDNKWEAMDETRDAFTAVKLVENYTGSQAIDIDLYRPFAKLRVITTDMVELTKHDIIPTTAVVTYKTKHRVAYNALTGEAADASATKEHSYTIAAYGDNTETDRVLFTDYFFVDDEVVQFDMLVKDQNGKEIVTRPFNTDIFVKRNYLTTLKGDILTNGTDVNVTVKPDMGGNYDYEVKYVNSASGLQDAIDEIPAGGSGSITLEGDIDLGNLFAGLLSTRATVPDYCIEIPANVDITLNLNGKNVTTSYQQGSDSKHMYAFKNNGLLTITDSSAEGNGKVKSRGIYNYGKLTLDGGTIDACDHNGGYAVICYEGAEFVMNGGAVVTSNEDGDLPGDGYDATTLRVESGAKATINGGTITNVSNYTIALDNYGDTTIKGGTFTSVHTTIGNHSTMTIDGGSFTCNGLEGITAHALWADAGTTTINGGTFDGKDNYNGFNVDAGQGAVVNINGGKFLPVHSGSLYGEGTINVMGGEFFDNPSKFVNDDYTVVETENGLWTVVRKADVAKIGEVGYTSLAKAVAAVKDGETITLARDIIFDENSRQSSGGTWYEGLYYIGNKSFTIDLNGKTISQNGAVNDYLFLFKNDTNTENTINFINGTLDAGTSAYCALCTSTTSTAKITINLENVNLNGNNSNGAVAKIRGGAELNVNAGTVITGADSYVGIEAYGATVNIYEGAEIYQNGKSSYVGSLVGVSGNGTVNVYGGKGTSAQGGFIAMTSGGTINVSGGEWTANTDGTCANDNKGVLIAQSESGAKSVVNVTGGTFKGGYNCYGAAVGDAQINIKGGNFNSDPAYYVVTGYESEEENGVWTVVVDPAAKIGETEYASLQEAFDVGGEITLLRDITLAETVVLAEGKTVVLNLDGKKILGGLQTDTSKHIYPFNIYGSLTINDSSANGSIEGRGIYVQTGSKLIVNGGSIYGIDSNGGSAIWQYGGDITINGGLIEQQAEGTNNFAINGLGGTVTVTGGKIAGNHGAIATAATEVVLNDGKFVCTGTTGMTDNVLYSYGSGTIIINGGTFTADNDGPAGGCCVYDANGGVTINGGVFGNSSGGDVWGTTGTTIKGGKFENLTETSHIAEGYEMNANGEVVAK